MSDHLDEKVDAVLLSTITPSTPLAELPEYMTVPEVADYLRVSRGVIYSMVASGELPGRRFRRLLRIHRSALNGTR